MIVINGTLPLLEEFYGEAPKSSMKTLVAVSNGKPVGVAGLRIEDAKMVVFSDMSDELREHPKFKRIMVTAYRKLFLLLPNMPVYANACPEINGAEVLLKHLGFKHFKGDVWLV